MLYYYGPWVEQSLCKDNPDAEPDVWFDEPNRARKICMKCPVKDECLFTALELVRRGETIKGIWGGLSAVQLRRAMVNPNSIPKMRGQRSRAKNPPIFLVPIFPDGLMPDEDQCMDIDDELDDDCEELGLSRSNNHLDETYHRPFADVERPSVSIDPAYVIVQTPKLEG